MSRKKLNHQDDFDINGLEDTDFGLVFDKSGQLKGVFVPHNYDESYALPKSIVEILAMFGISNLCDEIEKIPNARTLH